MSVKHTVAFTDPECGARLLETGWTVVWHELNSVGIAFEDQKEAQVYADEHTDVALWIGNRKAEKSAHVRRIPDGNIPDTSNEDRPKPWSVGRRDHD